MSQLHRGRGGGRGATGRRGGTRGGRAGARREFERHIRILPNEQWNQARFQNIKI